MHISLARQGIAWQWPVVYRRQLGLPVPVTKVDFLPETHLTVAQVPQVAEILSTAERFLRWLVAENRITHARFGTDIHMARPALDTYVTSGRRLAKPTRPGPKRQGAA